MTSRRHSRHVVSPSTHTVEMAQIKEINERLADDATGGGLDAAALGVAGVQVHPDSLDTVAVHRAHLPAHLTRAAVRGGTLAPSARLQLVIAAGAPSFPYLYGLFSNGGASGPLLPVPLHTDQLHRISSHLHLKHRWGL